MVDPFSAEFLGRSSMWRHMPEVAAVAGISAAFANPVDSALQAALIGDIAKGTIGLKYGPKIPAATFLEKVRTSAKNEPLLPVGDRIAKAVGLQNQAHLQLATELTHIWDTRRAHLQTARDSAEKQAWFKPAEAFTTADRVIVHMLQEYSTAPAESMKRVKCNKHFPSHSNQDFEPDILNMRTGAAIVVGLDNIIRQEAQRPEVTPWKHLTQSLSIALSDELHDARMHLRSKDLEQAIPQLADSNKKPVDQHKFGWEMFPSLRSAMPPTPPPTGMPYIFWANRF